MPSAKELAVHSDQGNADDTLALQALIEAEKKGETWKHLGLLPAPHHVGADGVVQVPPKWENMVLHSAAFKEHQAAEKGQPGKGGPLKAK